MRNRIKHLDPKRSINAAGCSIACPFAIVVAEEILIPELVGDCGGVVTSIYRHCDCALHGRYAQFALVDHRPHAKASQIWWYNLEKHISD